MFQEVSKKATVPNYEPRGRAFESLRACQRNQALRPIFGLAFLLCGGFRVQAGGQTTGCSLYLAMASQRLKKFLPKAAVLKKYMTL